MSERVCQLRLSSVTTPSSVWETVLSPYQVENLETLEFNSIPYSSILTVGRAPSCFLQLNHLSVSAIHCCLVVLEYAGTTSGSEASLSPHCYIVDVSTNGTQVNEKVLPKNALCRLSSNDVVTIGRRSAHSNPSDSIFAFNVDIAIMSSNLASSNYCSNEVVSTCGGPAILPPLPVDASKLLPSATLKVPLTSRNYKTTTHTCNDNPCKDPSLLPSAIKSSLADEVQTSFPWVTPPAVKSSLNQLTPVSGSRGTLHGSKTWRGSRDRKDDIGVKCSGHPVDGQGPPRRYPVNLPRQPADNHAAEDDTARSKRDQEKIKLLKEDNRRQHQLIEDLRSQLYRAHEDLEAATESQQQLQQRLDLAVDTERGLHDRILYLEKKLRLVEKLWKDTQNVTDEQLSALENKAFSYLTEAENHARLVEAQQIISMHVSKLLQNAFSLAEKAADPEALRSFMCSESRIGKYNDDDAEFINALNLDGSPSTAKDSGGQLDRGHLLPSKGTSGTPAHRTSCTRTLSDLTIQNDSGSLPTSRYKRSAKTGHHQEDLHCKRLRNKESLPTLLEHQNLLDYPSQLHSSPESEGSPALAKEHRTLYTPITARVPIDTILASQQG